MSKRDREDGPGGSGEAPESMDETLPASVAGGSAELPVVDDRHYVVVGEHARGGLGRILDARDRRLGRPVAIKELLRPGPDDQARFAREALVTARLQHPAIVPVYEAGRWPSGVPFYAMKLVRGPSLEAVIRETVDLNERLALLPHVIDVANALAYAHEQRIIHRDLKPANVLVGAWGETVVVDWGLAKDLARAGDGESTVRRGAASAPPNASGETLEGSVMGTPSYMPPEQARGEPVDERADVYAIGAILHHVLSGEPPYVGRSSGEVLAQVLSGPPAPLEARERRVPRDLLGIVRKAMAYDAHDRYPTARELAEDLVRFQRGQLVSAHAYGPATLLWRWIRRHRAPVAVAAAAAVALAALAGVGVRRIVRERDFARAQRAAAERAEAEAVRRSDDLALLEARLALDRAPREALTWLGRLSDGFDAWGRARVIAGDAWSRGLPAAALVLDGPARTLAVSPDGRYLVAAAATDDGRQLVAWDLDHRDVLGPARARGESDALAFDGRTVAYGADERGIWLWELSELTFKTRRPSIRRFRPSAGGDAHEAEVVALALSSDERWLASAAADGAVVLWDRRARDGRVLAAPGGPAVARLAFAPDGRWLAAADASGRLLAWPLDAGAPGAPVAAGAHEGGVAAIAIVGRVLASAGGDGGVRVFDLEARSSRVLGVHPDPTALAFAPAGGWLAVGERAGRVHAWDVVTGQGRALGTHEQAVRALAFAPDGRALASGGADDVVRVWSLDGGRPVVLRGHARDVTALAWPRAGTLASAGEDGRVLLWDPAAWRPPSTGDADDGVTVAAWTPGGDAVAWGTASGRVRMWWPRNPRAEAATLGQHGARVTALAFSPDGRRLASAGLDDKVRLWDGAAERLLADAGSDVTSLAFAPDGAALAWGRGDGVIELAELEGGARRSLVGHEARVVAIAFAADGTLWSGAEDRTVRVWDLRAGAEVQRFAQPSPVVDLAASGDGRVLAWATEWDVVVRRPGAALAAYAVEGGPLADVAVAPDGARVAAAARDRQVVVIDVAASHRRAFAGHAGAVSAVTFSPDGGTLASGGDGGELRLWDPASGEGRLIEAHRGAVTAIAFTADGRLASGGRDGAVRVWRDDLPRGPALRAWWTEHLATVP